MNPGWYQAKHECRPMIHDPTPRSAGSAVNRDGSWIQGLLFLRTGLNPALDLTLGPSASLTELNGQRMLSLEKLKVHDRAFACVANLAQISTHWVKRHAVVDQLLRASESVVVLNLAEGNGRRMEADRGTFFESVGILIRGLVEHA